MAQYLIYIYIIVPIAIIGWFVIASLIRSRRRRALIIRSLDAVLYEIKLPHRETNSEEPFSQDISIMEKLYASMANIDPYVVLEIGLPANSDSVAFFASIPRGFAEMFEKQLQGFFPSAQLIVRSADYNPFRTDGSSTGSVAELKNHYAFPIKTYDKFESDPITVLINAFSKLEGSGEGAAVQLVIKAPNGDPNKFVSKVSERLRTGESIKDVLSGGESISSSFIKSAGELASRKKTTADNYSEEQQISVDESSLELVDAKAAHPIRAVTLRVIASASTKERADTIRTGIESVFAQFGESRGNTIQFKHQKRRRLAKTLKNFAFRLPAKDSDAMRLNYAELATIFHLPSRIQEADVPHLSHVRTREVAPPQNLTIPSAVLEGVLLGVNSYRGAETQVFFSQNDRRRHLYVIGQTGTGKSVLLKNMITQDIEAGRGVCYIDPHGSDIQDILTRIPESRAGDVIYFDPGDVERPMGLNMLEYDPKYPEQKTFVVNELLGIFNKLFDMKISGGPMFEQYFRNATMLVLDDPSTPATLFEVVRVLSDDAYRREVLARATNPIVISFWRDVAEKALGEASRQNMVPYITSKFDNFLSNDIMRPIIGQQKSAFNFRDVMDNKKILLVNLSKGRLGDINSSLIGLIIVGKLLMASLSRVDMPEEARSDFYLYIDEFQNVTTDSIATILSEARKYRLNLIIAHQFVAQLEETISKAVFGNVGSISVFRVGAEDAELFEKQFEPVFTPQDIMNIDNYNAYTRLLVDGQTTRPFNMRTLPFENGDVALGERIRSLSSSRFGRPRDEVEREIKSKYLNSDDASSKG